MQHEERLAKLIDWFERAALAHAAAMEVMHEEAATLQAERLDRVFAALLREDGLEEFLVLLNNKEPAVSGMAAVYGMRYAPKRCTAVLAALAQEPGLLGFRASVALELWESGEWPH
ncbi:hypothetical protein LPW11_15410 [Geomonas sp. RF6]|uniref:hypothetical protein n=1 Tax=Geomonas sp. RF6 TaxID=2897342 RepID=UPI001E5A9F5B|nr:hypothetical protein [Geomonas sp. RF6]UFS69278.1 hypothetical protein LPW11_15410 [Geomonas sp. RF6]